MLKKQNKKAPRCCVYEKRAWLKDDEVFGCGYVRAHVFV
jgi:hypothetical protein